MYKRQGYLLAGFTAFFTMWSNAAVGIIGDDEWVNQFFFWMVLGGIALSLLARFRPVAMRWITGAIALGQIAMGFVAMQVMPGHGVEWGVIAFFALLWGSAAWCFDRAVRNGRPA